VEGLSELLVAGRALRCMSDKAGTALKRLSDVKGNSGERSEKKGN